MKIARRATSGPRYPEAMKRPPARPVRQPVRKPAVNAKEQLETARGGIATIIIIAVAP